MKRRRTEVDFLNGHVSAEGRKKGVPTPFNDAIVAAVHAPPRRSAHAEPQEPRSADRDAAQGATAVTVDIRR